MIVKIEESLFNKKIIKLLKEEMVLEQLKQQL